MADRSAARIFGRVFRMLATDPTPQHIEWAKQLWDVSRSYDFTPMQMDCDNALFTLGVWSTSPWEDT